MTSLLNSSLLALGALAIALPIGVSLALLLARFNLPGRRLAIACLGLLLFVPLYIQLSAWDAAFGKLGWFTFITGSLAQPFLSGMRGAIFIHGLAAFPWVALVIGIGLRHVDPAQEEAALLVVPPRLVFWRITLPQVLPFIAAAAIWTAVSTISDMTVTNIYLINPGEWTYTERFYMRMASQDTSNAAFGILPGVLSLAAIVGCTLWMVSRLMSQRVLVSLPRTLVFSLGKWQPLATASLWILVLILVGLPILSLISKAGFVVIHHGTDRIRSWSLWACLGQIASVPFHFPREFLGTIEVALGAATLSLFVSLPLAWKARRGGWRAFLTVSAIVFGLAIPGPLVGTTLIHLFNHDLPPSIPLPDGSHKSWLLLLYDNTPLAPIIAQSIRALPLTIMLLWHSFATLSDDVLSAASLDGLSPLRVFEKIALPQRWRAVLAAWIIAFAVAAGDLAWCHLVTPPGLDLLQRRVFGLVHSGVEEQVAAISLVVILAYALIAGSALWLINRQERVRRHAEMGRHS
jgi:iron(III) transport system permease protein